jgi:hypothetical protein
VVADIYTIPGLSEALIGVYVSRKKEVDYDEQAEYLVEPADGFVDRYQLVMAFTLLDINKATTCKVRVLNPFESDITLRKGAEIVEQRRLIEWSILLLLLRTQMNPKTCFG